MTESKPASGRKTSHMPYAWLVIAIAALAAVSYGAGDHILQKLAASEDAETVATLASLALFGFCSFVSFYATWNTPLPSFVVAIALGMAGHRFFEPIVSNHGLLASLVTGSAAIILFGGGLEMPLRSFLRLIIKIVLLAIPGVLITGFALSWVIGTASGAMGFGVAAAVAVLLGAILASTDPAAIIPVLEKVRFKRRDTKDIVIAESALNDVVGTLLTSTFLKLPLAGIGLVAAYESLASPVTYGFLASQTAYGFLFGLAGFALLWLLNHLKRGHDSHFGADQIYFVLVPLLAFVGAVVFGGSGFLAAFVAGLLFHAEEHMKAIESFFFNIIDGVAKPVIFVLVGAMVDLHSLLAYAPLGILVALVFMFVIRPIVVFLMLGIFGVVPGSQGLSLKELLFISFVRETGAIPAVLLVTAVSKATVPVNGLVEIGMWVILMTLVIAPPLTPLVAKRLGVAE
jgi:NhaP-type Na+/H+ or K+/H+ antiporter